MASTRYTFKALQNKIKSLQNMFPNAELKDWGIEVFITQSGDNNCTRIWADFIRSDDSDLIQAYTRL